MRRDVKFDEKLSTCEPNSMFVPSSTYQPSSTFVPSSSPIMVSSLVDDNEDEHPPLPTHLPPNESIEHEHAPAPSLLRWVCSTHEATGDLEDDPLEQHQTHSQFQQASFLLDKVSEIHDPDIFAEPSSHSNSGTQQ
jgi:hypothetical protein